MTNPAVHIILVNLAEVTPETRSSYMPGGATRVGGKPPRREEVRKLRDMKFKAARGMAADLAKLDAAMVQLGGDLRITETFRDVNVQAAERMKYDTWVKAGKPAPGARGFNSSTMRTTYVARPGASNHGWGGAFDLDIAALALNGLRPGSNEALAAFWPLARAHGFTPVIAHPLASMSEAWHFDHWGPFQATYDLAKEAGNGNPYGLASSVANILQGNHPGPNAGWRYVQSRILAHGVWCGEPDGDPGKMTRGAIASLGLTFTSDVTAMQAALIEAGIGQEAIDAA